jgi:hypothetical protein
MSLFKPDSLPANMDAISFSFGANSCSSEARPPESWTAALQDSAPEYYGVQLEPGWRERVPTNFGDPSRILVCRWKHSSPHMHERETNGDPDYAIVAITLQPTELELVADGQCLLNGGSKPGMVVVTPPGCPARVTFRSACDFLHLYVPTARLSGIARGATSSASTDYLKRSGLWAPDPAVERLAWLLLKAGDFDAESGAVYMDGPGPGHPGKTS